MVDPTPPPGSPPGNAPPAGTPPAPGTPLAPPAVARPEWLPESHWDATANTIKPEFGTHYAELATFHKTETEKRAAIPAKPEDYKIEVVLPPEVKPPPGVELKIDEKDPRIPLVREFAHKFGLPQEAVSALVTLDAQMKIAQHQETEAFAAAELKKLGDNAKARTDAVDAWAKGLVGKNEITAEEYQEIRVIGATAAGVSVLEKIMAKVNGVVPGHRPDPPAPPQPKSWADRMWPGGFNPNPSQQKAS